MFPICYIAIGVMSLNQGGPLPAQAVIRKDAIVSMVAAHMNRGNGPRLETRITLQGDAVPLYTLFTPGEVARLPCRDYGP